MVGEQYFGVKCPFFKDNICSIYPARPFVCRKYIVIDVCNMGQENHVVDEGYIIGMTYDWIVSHHIRKNLKRYTSILTPLQIKVTEESDLDCVYDLKFGQKCSDIRENFSDIFYN